MAKSISADGIENVDLVGEYLDEDPSILSTEQLQEIATAFGLPLFKVRKLAAGMSAARSEIRDPGNADVTIEEDSPASVEAETGVVSSGWRALWASGGGNPYHDPATGRFTTGNGPNSLGEPALSADMKAERDAITEEIRSKRAASGKAPYAENSLRGMAIKEHQARIAARESGVNTAEAEYEKAIQGKEIGSPERKAAFEKYRAAKEAAKTETAVVVEKARTKGLSASELRAEAVRRYGGASGNLARLGGSLVLTDQSWRDGAGYVPEVAQHLKDLNAIPAHLVDEFVSAGGKVYVGNGPITALDPDLKRLSGVQPRGWPAGTSYDDVAGVFNPATGTMVLGNITGGRSGKPVSNFAFHEFGHGMDSLRKKVALLSQEDSFKALHLDLINGARGYINGYYVQKNGPEGAGLSETFADSMRGYLKGLVKASGETTAIGKREVMNATMRASWAESGTLVSGEMAGRIIAHMEKRFGTPEGKNTVEPKAAVERQKRAYVKTKKTAAKDVSFAEESRARSLKKSGKTIAEISEELKISVGLLSKILRGL